MRLAGFAAALVLSAAFACSAGAQGAPARATQDAEPVAEDTAPLLAAGASANAEDAVAALLLEAMRTRAALRRGDAAQAAAGDALWSSVKAFAALVSEASSADKPLFSPIVDAAQARLRSAMADASIPDLDAVEAVREAIDEQVSVRSGSGYAPGDDQKFSITVRPIRNNRPVTGYYVWVDSPRLVRPDGPAMNLSALTSLPSFKSIPATYLFRVVRQGRVVGSLKQFVGADHPVVDVEVTDVP